MIKDIPKVERQITFDGKEITVIELTVAQVRGIFNKLENNEGTGVIDELFSSNIPALAIAEATGIAFEELEKYSPSELDSLAKEVERTNPFLDTMIEKRLKIYEEMRMGIGHLRKK